MMKKIFLGLVTALLAFALLACETKPDTPDPTPDEPKQTETEHPSDSPSQNEQQKPDEPQNEPGNQDEPDTPDEPDEPDNTQNGQWPTTGIAKRIPAPQKGEIESLTDERTFLRADIKNTDAEYAKEYAAACKEMGFTLDISEDAIDSSTYIFSAKNEKGYKVYVSYTGIMIVTISAP